MCVPNFMPIHPIVSDISLNTRNVKLMERLHEKSVDHQSQ